jgi:hypothetical protein
MILSSDTDADTELFDTNVVLNLKMSFNTDAVQDLTV